MNNLLKGNVQLRVKSTGSKSGNVFWQNLKKKQNKKDKRLTLLFKWHHYKVLESPSWLSFSWLILHYLFIYPYWTINKKKRKKKKHGENYSGMAWLPGFWSPAWSLQDQPCLLCWIAAVVTHYYCCCCPERWGWCWARCCHTFIQWTNVWSQKASLPTGKKKIKHLEAT